MPSGQAAQVEDSVAFTAAENVLTGHRVQSLANVLDGWVLYRPAEQGSQVSAPSDVPTHPAGQLSQVAVAASFEKVPRPHFTQGTALEAPCCSPFSHCEHSVDAAALEYWPLEQAVQVSMVFASMALDMKPALQDLQMLCLVASE